MSVPILITIKPTLIATTTSSANAAQKERLFRVPNGQSAKRRGLVGPGATLSRFPNNPVPPSSLARSTLNEAPGNYIPPVEI